MKHRMSVSIAAIIALALITAVVILRQPSTVKAQTEVPPPTNDRISFGTVGIASGQSLRVSVANTIMPGDANWPPGPTRVVMTFRMMNGNLARDARTGDVIRKTVDIDRGDSAFLDVDYSELPPGPIRAQLRPMLVVTPPAITEAGQNAIPPGSSVPTVEIINNANGRSQFAVFTHPAVIRGFNPQPDPPSPE